MSTSSPIQRRMAQPCFVWGSWDRGREHALAAIQRFFFANRMLYARGTIGAGGVEEAHVRSDKRAITEAEQLAQRIVELTA